MPLDHHPSSPHPETTAGDDAGAATLRAVFIADERPAYLGLYTGARCELPGGEVVEVRHRRTPLYDLARELQTRGYGDCHLESFTPTGTTYIATKDATPIANTMMTNILSLLFMLPPAAGP